ncbi:lactonase family protein [Gordonia sp. KTR9]|uniref:lactonase family protein n=1 Tax=Gordonia sp. KTR9 TaxID=337191 RepID=UPI001EE65098|nr:beta-propeller fold lactonase family protein [Gordonia sp. KTR9]
MLRADGGTLTPVSSTTAAAGFSLGLIGHPNRRFIYGSGVASGTIQGWRISKEGRLVPLPGGLTRPGEPVTGLGISPDGRYMVATVGALKTTMVTYRVSVDGRLTPISRTAQPHAVSPLGHPLFTPDGKHVYVPSFVLNTMDAYAFSDSGELTHIGATQTTGIAPALGSITPDGKYLYITNEQSHSISGWRINSDGTLTSIGAPFVGLMPHGMAITRDSRHLYSPMTMGMSVGQFRIGGSGTLNSLGSMQVEPTRPPARVVLSEDESWLYVIDVTSLSTGTAHVTSFRVLPSGRLARANRPPIDTGLVFADGDTAFTIIPSG